MGFDCFAMGIVMEHDHDSAISHLQSSSPQPFEKEAAAEEISVPGGGLPVGYRFRPTDVELVKHYLMEKAFNPASPLPAFIGLDIDAFEFCSMTPSDLGKKGVGFWISGLKKMIYDSTGALLAYKSELTYCVASTVSSSRQRKTHWKLDEYRLHSPLNLRGQEWLLARLKRGSDYEKKYS